MNKDNKALNEQQLESAVGGGQKDAAIGWVTEMECSSCGHRKVWAGRYGGKVFDCPECGQHTFTGIREM